MQQIIDEKLKKSFTISIVLGVAALVTPAIWMLLVNSNFALIGIVPMVYALGTALSVYQLVMASKSMKLSAAEQASPSAVAQKARTLGWIGVVIAILTSLPNLYFGLMSIMALFPTPEVMM